MRDSNLNAILLELSKLGWRIRPRSPSPLKLDPLVTKRFPHIPEDYLLFLHSIATCTNPDESVWILCEDNFNCFTPECFRWNEFELMGLNAAMVDYDLPWAAKIHAFWEQHLPIMQSVHSDYAFLGISFAERYNGWIVAGVEPEIEQVTPICSSFTELLKLLTLGEAAFDQFPVLVLFSTKGHHKLQMELEFPEN